jgi:hypothetical protein
MTTSGVVRRVNLAAHKGAWQRSRCRNLLLASQSLLNRIRYTSYAVPIRAHSDANARTPTRVCYRYNSPNPL